MARGSHSRRLFVAPDPVPLPLANSNEYNFDNNMVIILSALLCALICVLGLNSIIRCAIKFTRRNISDGQDLPTLESAPKESKMEALIKIPVVAFVSGTKLCDIVCPICLGEFEEGANLRILPTCNHGFHVMCIDKWLVSNSSCPMCRHLLFEVVA